MPEYVKLPDDPAFYYYEEDRPLEKMPDIETVYIYGLFPVRTVTESELEALKFTGESEEEE